MVKHVVCFRLKDNSPEACEKAKETLLSMQGKVEQLRSIQVGIDFLRSPRSFDVILEVGLDDRKALEDYQNHPYHVDVVKKYMHSVYTESIAVDYEME